MPKEKYKIKNKCHRTYEDLLESSIISLNLKTFNEVCEIYDEVYSHINDCTPLVSYQKHLYEFLHTLHPEWLNYRLLKIPGFIDMFKDGPLYYAQFSKKNIIHDNKMSDAIEIDINDIVESSGYIESFRHFPKDNSEVLEIAYIPNYTTDLTDYVYNVSEHHKEPGILYHVCPKQIWENNILKTGIIPKANNKHKRAYAPRAYFFTQKLNFEKYANDLRNGIKDTAYTQYVNCNEYVVLQIDLNKQSGTHLYNFYEDTEYFHLSYCSVFTYETIHPKCIRVYQEITLV